MRTCYSTSQLHLLGSCAPRSFTSRLHISVAYVSRIAHLDLSFFSYSDLKAAHHICTSSAPLHPSDAPLCYLIFKAKRYQADSLVPLSRLPQRSLKVLVEPRGRSCAQRSYEPDTCCHLFGGTAFFTCSKLVVDPQFASPVVKVYYAS